MPLDFDSAAGSTPLPAVLVPSLDQPDHSLPAHSPAREARCLATGEVLFQQGEARTHVYRVESGAVRHYVRGENGRQDLIEFAFPGDVIGLGFLDHHATSAQATFETTVTAIPVAEIEDMARADRILEARLAAAIDIEFGVLRDCAIRSGQGKPLERLASFLLAVSSMAGGEGRDASRIPGALTCGYVANSLGMSLDDLVDGLKKLESRGLVAATGEGLELRDLPALAMLAEVD